MYRFDGSTLLVIHIDVTHTVTLQTTHILPPAGTQNALDESHKKASTQQAARPITLLARCRRAHGARLGRWRSQKHRWWPPAFVRFDLFILSLEMTALFIVSEFDRFYLLGTLSFSHPLFGVSVLFIRFTSCSPMPRGCVCLGFYVCDLDFGFSIALCLFIYWFLWEIERGRRPRVRVGDG